MAIKIEKTSHNIVLNKKDFAWILHLPRYFSRFLHFQKPCRCISFEGRSFWGAKGRCLDIPRRDQQRHSPIHDTCPNAVIAWIPVSFLASWRQKRISSNGLGASRLALNIPSLVNAQRALISRGETLVIVWISYSDTFQAVNLGSYQVQVILTGFWLTMEIFNFFWRDTEEIRLTFTTDMMDNVPVFHWRFLWKPVCLPTFPATTVLAATARRELVTAHHNARMLPTKNGSTARRNVGGRISRWKRTTTESWEVRKMREIG